MTTNSSDTTTTSGVTASQLLSYIERIEKLTEEKKDIQSDIKDIYAEADSNGYDKKAIRTIVKIRATPRTEREEQETLIDTYLLAIGE
jgi:uncharacterized protein (UPF0335 family)